MTEWKETIKQKETKKERKKGRKKERKYTKTDGLMDLF